MICLGIDPGSRSTGLALWKDGRIVELDAATVKAPKGSNPRSRFAGMMAAVGEILIAWEDYDVDRIAVEWMHIRNGAKERDPSAITDVAHYGGGVLVLAQANFPDATVSMPRPSDWKGSVPKNIHQERLIARMPECAEFGLTKTQMKDALDGAGLARWVATASR